MTSLNINFLANNINLDKTLFFFYAPGAWNFILLNFFKLKTHYLLYLYSSSYYFFVAFGKPFSQFYINKFTKTLMFSNLYVNNFFSLYWTVFKNLFYSFSKIFFKKLKFKGKGYYIYKNIRNTIAPQFGYSHMIRMYGFFTSLKFITKTIIFVFGINKYDILRISKIILHKRPHNIFTGKGVRFSRQIIYKKTGKISTYR